MSTNYAGIRTLLILAVSLLPLLSHANDKLLRPLLILGDSLSAGYGIDPSEGWVALLKQRLETEDIDIEVVNASISGETSAGGVSRLTPLLEKYRPSVVVIELGGNDGLRGYPITQMRQQLSKAVELSQAHNAKVLMLGMQIPPNYGPRYSRMFSQSYALIADTKQVPLTPFFLEDVAVHPELMQSDGIHPTAEGQPQLLENVWPDLQPILQALGTDSL
ncbi:MAG: arylesterase [Cellvibrionaceae bacterium]